MEYSTEDGLSRHGGREIEIGPGKGMYILERAARNPSWSFVAIEVKARLVRFIEERAHRRGLENLRVIRGDARAILPDLGAEQGFDLASVHFPDPWWKKRHHKRAVLSHETLGQIRRLLVPGGLLLIQTDVFPRADRALRLLTEHEGLENTRPGGGFVAANPTGCRTNRERVCEDLGLPVFRMLFRKVELDTPGRPHQISPP